MPTCVESRCGSVRLPESQCDQIDASRSVLNYRTQRDTHPDWRSTLTRLPGFAVQDHPTDTIYVALLNVDRSLWIPVQSRRRADGTYQILSKNDDPASEQWQFSSGSLVRCAERELGEGVRLVAVESVRPVALSVVR